MKTGGNEGYVNMLQVPVFEGADELEMEIIIEVKIKQRAAQCRD